MTHPLTNIPGEEIVVRLSICNMPHADLVRLFVARDVRIPVLAHLKLPYSSTKSNIEERLDVVGRLGPNHFKPSKCKQFAETGVHCFSLQRPLPCTVPTKVSDIGSIFQSIFATAICHTPISSLQINRRVILCVLDPCVAIILGSKVSRPTSIT